MGCSCCDETTVTKAGTPESEINDECGCGACAALHGHSHDHGMGHGHDEADARPGREMRLLAIRFVVSAVLFACGLVLSFLPASPVPAVVIKVLFVLSWLIAGFRVAYNAVRNILRGEVFDENFLMTVATVGAFIIGQWSEGAAVMLFFNLGEMVQESAVNRSRRSITDLMDVRPDVARLAAGDVEVHPSKVPEGTLIRVLPGEKVPLDGMVTEGSSSFDTAALTGESMPREASSGSEALAGFVNGSGVIVIRTTTTYAETAASKMLELIENAQNRKAKAEKLITSFARVYTPIVTIGALLLAVIPPLVLLVSGSGAATGWELFRPWVSRGLVFLVISCPCAFVISVPLGFFGGIGGAAKRGILVKGADYIDVLAKARAVVFDKTGTLTRGEFRVQLAESAAGFSEREVIAFAVAAELRSTHPVALAIRAHAESLGLAVDAGKLGEVAERAGYGVSAVYDGKALLAGSRKLMEESAIAGLPEGSPSSAVAGTEVLIGYDGRYAGRLVLSDVPKEDAARAVERLRTLGVGEIVMLTGDTERAARAVAAKVGIDNVRSGVLPHQKVSAFEEISARVKAADPKASVIFVGDGINDAPVLARADAGLAMGGIGSDAAIEAADVVLMNDSPMLVADAIVSARWTRHIVFENIALSFAIKIGFLALGAFGIATLWEAVFADVGVALLATLNSLRARR
jgi:Cd2+/Zn2+-exporting ATPase